MATVTWLLLSDLHFKSGEEFEEFNREVVLEALWEDINEQVAAGLKPDFIIFSGDVAFHGRAEEYELAGERFFDPLLEITGLSKDRLFVVPGNHDVDWDEIYPLIVPGMRNLLINRDRVNQFLSSAQERDLAFCKFNAYAQFINTYFEGTLTFSTTEYFYTHTIGVQGYEVAILGLNSAWMSAYVKDDHGEVTDQGNLLIGERQLKEALDRVERADLRIAVLHHPIEWLHEIDRFGTQKQLSARCDLVLHGHWHRSQMNVQHSLAGQVVYIPVGAIYASRDHPNGYNFVQIDLNLRQGKVYIRRYNDEGPEGPVWIKDILSTGEGLEGVVKFALPQKSLAPLPPLAGKKVLLVENELEWQEIIQSILVPPDFELQIVASYAEAKSALRKPYDLIIINLCLLPGDSDYLGEALLRDLTGGNIPCIVLTGSATRMRGLFERYSHVCEVFSKGIGDARAFKGAQFLEVVEEATKG